MCGRIARERDDFALAYGFPEFAETRVRVDLGNWTGHYNIAPTQEDVILRPADGVQQLVASRWGLIPVWAKDRSIASKTFNARSETLLERSAFRTLVGGRRCVIPASGFYEWQKAGKGKQPLYIHRAGGGPIALAGLWTEWTDPETGERVTSHTVITCPPNELMAQYHNRMPAILEGDALIQWLDADFRDGHAAQSLLVPLPDDRLAVRPVSTLVNNVRNYGPELIAPVEP
jgi:putative SOS response-associated peptidase YedK